MGTRFTRLVGCGLPFQLAVLGGVGTTDLAPRLPWGAASAWFHTVWSRLKQNSAPPGFGFLIRIGRSRNNV